MSRSRLTQTPVDLVTDGGAVLISLVKGEQLEFPVVLNFLADATLKDSNNYIYEAVLVEAKNVSDQSSPPTEIQPSGTKTTLVVRVPEYIGIWDLSFAYTREDIVLYNGTYYKLLGGVGRVNSTLPTVDPLWEETSLNKVYIQFPKTISSTWSVAPTVTSSVYAFLELRVTEPTDAIFTRTWKPVRGMIEVLFSPTDIVDDV